MYDYENENGEDDDENADARARAFALYVLSAIGFVLLGVVLGAVADWLTHR